MGEQDSVQFPEEASALATLTRRHLDPARVRPEYVEEAVQLLQELSPRLLSALPGTALTGLITGEEMCVVAAQVGTLPPRLPSLPALLGSRELRRMSGALGVIRERVSAAGVCFWLSANVCLSLLRLNGNQEPGSGPCRCDGFEV